MLTKAAPAVDDRGRQGKLSLTEIRMALATRPSFNVEEAAALFQIALRASASRLRGVGLYIVRERFVLNIEVA